MAVRTDVCRQDPATTLAPDDVLDRVDPSQGRCAAGWSLLLIVRFLVDIVVEGCFGLYRLGQRELKFHVVPHIGGATLESFHGLPDRDQITADPACNIW